MYNTIVLFLTLVGGFAFSTTWHGSLYHAARESGHRLYFRAIFYAVFIAYCGVTIHLVLFDYFDSYPHLLGQIKTIFLPGYSQYKEVTLWGKESILMISFLGFLVAPVLGHLLNRVPWLGKACLKSAVEISDFERMVLSSLYKEKQILITLSSNKVYLGWAVRASNPTAERKYLRILPLASGFRDSETQELEFTTSYSEILTRIQNQDD